MMEFDDFLWKLSNARQREETNRLLKQQLEEQKKTSSQQASGPAADPARSPVSQYCPECGGPLPRLLVGACMHCRQPLAWYEIQSLPDNDEKAVIVPTSTGSRWHSGSLRVCKAEEVASTVDDYNRRQQDLDELVAEVELEERRQKDENRRRDAAIADRDRLAPELAKARKSLSRLQGMKTLHALLTFAGIPAFLTAFMMTCVGTIMVLVVSGSFVMAGLVLTLGVILVVWAGLSDEQGFERRRASIQKKISKLEVMLSNLERVIKA